MKNDQEYKEAFLKAVTTLKPKDVARWLDFLHSSANILKITVETSGGGIIELTKAKPKKKKASKWNQGSII